MTPPETTELRLLLLLSLLPPTPSFSPFSPNPPMSSSAVEQHEAPARRNTGSLESGQPRAQIEDPPKQAGDIGGPPRRRGTAGSSLSPNAGQGLVTRLTQNFSELITPQRSEFLLLRLISLLSPRHRSKERKNERVGVGRNRQGVVSCPASLCLILSPLACCFSF